MVLLPAGETITAISMARPGDWHAVPENESGSFSVRALRPVPDSAMTVSSAARTYSFVLSSSPEGPAPKLVRITGVGKARGRAPRHPQDETGTGIHVYRMSGNRELWPSRIRDDGMKTYLEWRADQALPAVFALDRLGREEMVNGYMRGQTFTIDRVHERLVFRIDKASGQARREELLHQQVRDAVCDLQDTTHT